MAIGLEFPTVLDAARVGAEWAWAELYRDLAPVVLGYLRARGAHSPEDVCGEVFCQIVRDISTFSGDEDGFRSWVFVIAHRRLLDESRTRRRRPETPVTPDDLVGLTAPGGPEDEAIANLTDATVRQLIERLTPGQRDVILLRLVGGLSLAEVVAVTGKGERAVKSLQHRGLEALRRLIESSEGVAALTQSPCNETTSAFSRTPSRERQEVA